MKDKSQEGKKIRETILRGSPLLEVFINGNLGNRVDWVDEMTEPFTELYNKMTNYYGNSFADMLKPLVEMGDSYDLFDSSYPDRAKELILDAVVVMGMEIRDKAVCHMFAEDIVKRLVEIRCFDQTVMSNADKKKDAKAFVKGVLWSGIAWLEEIDTNYPDDATRFLTDLKF